MEQKYTPGPWSVTRYRTQNATNPNQTVITSENHVLARVNKCDLGEDQTAANARLIAAAPDLLEALQEAMRWTGSLTDWAGAGDPDIEMYRAAIAKATGDALQQRVQAAIEKTLD